jgi:hypothetical protein
MVQPRAPASRRSFGRSSSRWLHGCTADAASGDMPETSEAVLAYTRTVGSTAPCKSTNELRIIHTMCFVRASYIGLYDVLVVGRGSPCTSVTEPLRMPTPPRDPPPTATVVAAAVPAPLVQVAAPFPGWCPGVQPGSSTSGVIPMEHDNEKRDEYPLSTHAPPVPVPVPGLALQPMEPAHGPRRGMAGDAWPVDYARAAISMDLERQHLAGLMRYDPFAEPTTEELGTPPGQHCFHPWLGAQVADPFIDRTPMPPELAAALLRDTSYQPGSRPVHFRSPSMSRASRVFKEIIIRDPATNQFDTRQRRGKSVDFWHNSGGNRASTWLPKDNPVVKRRYGAIERLVPPEQGGKTRRTTVLNYHEYSLVDDEEST